MAPQPFTFRFLHRSLPFRFSSLPDLQCLHASSPHHAQVHSILPPLGSFSSLGTTYRGFVSASSSSTATASSFSPASSPPRSTTYFKSAAHKAMLLSMVRLDLQNRLLHRYHIFGQMECRVLSSSAMRPVLTCWAEFLLNQNPKCPLPPSPYSRIKQGPSASDGHADSSVTAEMPPEMPMSLYCLSPPEPVLHLPAVKSLRKRNIEVDWVLTRLVLPSSEDCIPLPVYPSVLRLDLPQFPYQPIELHQMSDFYGLLKWPFQKKKRTKAFQVTATTSGSSSSPSSSSSSSSGSSESHHDITASLQNATTVCNSKVEGMPNAPGGRAAHANTAVTGGDDRWRTKLFHCKSPEVVGGEREETPDGARRGAEDSSRNFGFADVRLTAAEAAEELWDVMEKAKEENVRERRKSRINKGRSDAQSDDETQQTADTSTRHAFPATDEEVEVNASEGALKTRRLGRGTEDLPAVRIALRRLQRESAGWRIITTGCDEDFVYRPAETETGFYGSKDFWEMA